MVRRDGAAVRKERLQVIARLVQRLLHDHGEISLSKTVASIEYEFGLTKDKVSEYLEILEGLGQFVLEKELNKIRKGVEG